MTDRQAKHKSASRKCGIKSMTGFGKGTEKSPYGKIEVEIKTLNNKSLSVTCNPFNGLFLLEENISKVLEDKIARGKVFVKIAQENEKSGNGAKKVSINEKIAADYLKKIKSVQKALGVGGEVDIKDLLALPGVVESAEKAGEDDLWPYIKKAAEKAIDKLVLYREREGKHLMKDFTMRLNGIKKSLTSVKKYSKESINTYRDKLSGSISDMTKGIGVDKSKLEAEVGLFAKNCDVSEEVTRLEAHVEEYRSTMTGSMTEAGKKLDFIAQEMQREANTIGAKANDYRMSKVVISVKSEVERIREQVKNIE